MVPFTGLRFGLTIFRMNLTTPLECWREVALFKVAVADAETVRESLEPDTLEYDIICSDTSPRCDDTFITRRLHSDPSTRRLISVQSR